MSQAHKGSRLIGNGLLQSVDPNTIFLAHYDITENDVLRGISPIQNITTMRDDGKFGGGIAIEEGTSNFAQNTIATYASYYNYVREGNNHICYRHSTSTSNYLALSCDVFSSKTAVGNTVQYTISGFLYLNNKPYKTEVPHISTFHTNTIKRISRDDGYFEFTQTYNTSGWIIHSNLCNAVIGDTITIRNLQIETKPFASSFTSGVRGDGLLYYPESIFNYEKGTFSCWAKTNTLLAVKTLFFQWDATGSTLSHFGLRMDATGRIAFQIGASLLTSSMSYNDDQFHNYAVTWENGTNRCYLYVDGKLSASASSVINLQQIGGRHMGRVPIGHRGFTYSDEWWNGIIDEVRIDSVPRTAEEIEAWYVSGAPFFPKGVYSIAY